MEAENSANNDKMSGETTAVVLYWAAWCFLGLLLFMVVLSILVDDWPKTISSWKVLLYSIRQYAYQMFYMFVLFGISAILKVGNAIARQLSKLNTA